MERLKDMTQRKFLQYLLIDIVIGPWSEYWCPLRYQVYLVMNIISGNHKLGMILCFGFVDEKVSGHLGAMGGRFLVQASKCPLLPTPLLFIR